MKIKFLLSLSCSLLLAACAPQTSETAVSACPVKGLQRVTFFDGRPADEQPMVPTDGKNGELLWEFGEKAGNVYLTCSYAGGEIKTQKLPYMMTSCRAAYDRQGSHITMMKCKVRA